MAKNLSLKFNVSSYHPQTEKELRSHYSALTTQINVHAPGSIAHAQVSIGFFNNFTLIFIF